MSLIFICLAGEILGKVLTEPYVKINTEKRLTQIEVEHSPSPSGETEGVSYGDSYMMAAMYQSMGNDL